VVEAKSVSVYVFFSKSLLFFFFLFEQSRVLGLLPYPLLDILPAFWNQTSLRRRRKNVYPVSTPRGDQFLKRNELGALRQCSRLFVRPTGYGGKTRNRPHKTEGKTSRFALALTGAGWRGETTGSQSIQKSKVQKPGVWRYILSSPGRTNARRVGWWIFTHVC